MHACVMAWATADAAHGKRYVRVHGQVRLPALRLVRWDNGENDESCELQNPNGQSSSFGIFRAYIFRFTLMNKISDRKYNNQSEGIRPLIPDPEPRSPRWCIFSTYLMNTYANNTGIRVGHIDIVRIHRLELSPFTLFSLLGDSMQALVEAWG